MASRKKNTTFFEWFALAIVVLFPLSGVIWCVTSGNSSAAPAPQTPVTTAPATTQPQASAPAPAPASATITLDDPDALPTTVATAQIVPFSFTIKNTGSAQASFSYKVYVVWNSGEQDVIDENSVSIAGGASTDLSEALKFESASAKGTVYIQLNQSSESIHFAMPRA